MFIYWSLVNVSKGQQITLMLCVLSLIVQWSSHCSAQMEKTTAPSTNGSGAVNTTLDNSINATGEQSNSSAPNNDSITTIDGLQNQEANNLTGSVTAQMISTPLTNLGFPNKDGAEQSKIQDKKSKSDHPVVFTALLVSGLLLAAGMLGAYYRSSTKSWTPPSRRLDEEADAKDHDSIMFSVAPEDQSDAHDKPKLNGETQENGENTKPVAGAGTGESQEKKGREEGDTEL